MRVLVTGGAGFIGSHTVDLLLAEGMDVIVLDNLDPQVHGTKAGPGGNLGHRLKEPRLKFIGGDVRSKSELMAALEGVEAVLHLAAAVGVGQSMYEPRHYCDVNLTGTATLLQAITDTRAQLRKLVVASSMSIYGEGMYKCPPCGLMTPGNREAKLVAAHRWNPVCPQCRGDLMSVATDETAILRPTSIYAISKRTQEELALCFGRAYGVPTIGLRYFNTYGSRQSLNNPYTGVVAIFIGRLMNRKAPVVFEDGLQSRDFVHVRDVARANVQALMDTKVDAGVFNVGTGRATTIRALVDLLAQKVGADMEPTILNHCRTGDVRHCYAEVVRIREGIGWEATMGLREGVEELLEWTRLQRPSDHVDEAVQELSSRGLVS
jgi:dTDP-L-rhamnose 4-epimerase